MRRPRPQRDVEKDLAGGRARGRGGGARGRGRGSAGSSASTEPEMACQSRDAPVDLGDRHVSRRRAARSAARSVGPIRGAAAATPSTVAAAHSSQHAQRTRADSPPSNSLLLGQRRRPRRRSSSAGRPAPHGRAIDDEDAGAAAAERLGAVPSDRRDGCFGRGDDRVEARRRADVVRQCDAAPGAASPTPRSSAS